MTMEGSCTSTLSWVQAYLAIGPKPDPSSWAVFEKEGVRSVVDLNGDLDVRLEADRRGLLYAGFKVPVPTRLEDFLEFFPTVHEQIEEERVAGRKIYLHCTAGVYRTPTFAMAHLIGRGESIEDAVSLVRQVHKPTWTEGDPALTAADVESAQRALHLWNRRARASGHQSRHHPV